MDKNYKESEAIEKEIEEMKSKISAEMKKGYDKTIHDFAKG
jgi:hypothetical protein